MSAKKILVVDDDTDIREIIIYALDAEGYQVTGLAKGQAVVQEAERLHPDLILLDVLLGDADGRDICKVLKNSPETSAIPVVIVSGTHGRHTEHEKHCGANGYIEKPFDLEELIGSVRRYIAG